MATGVNPFVPTPPPPPSTGFYFPLTFPITIFNFDQAHTELARVNPDFNLDDVETGQLRAFLAARMTPQAIPKWVEWLEPGFAIAAILSAPLIACVLRPSIVQSPHYLYYSPLALVSCVAAVFLFRVIVALPALLRYDSNAVLIVWAGLIELFLFWSANALSRAPHLPAWAVWARDWANVILLAWIALILLSLIDPNFDSTNKTLDTLGKFPVLGKFAKRD